MPSKGTAHRHTAKKLLRNTANRDSKITMTYEQVLAAVKREMDKEA